MKIFSATVFEVGACTHRSAMTVTDAAQEITLAAGKNTLEVIPEETTDVYYGGSGVASTNGANIGAGKIWANCKKGFSVYLVCAAGLTCSVRIIEYD